jgi:hypothetical protein
MADIMKNIVNNEQNKQYMQRKTYKFICPTTQVIINERTPNQNKKHMDHGLMDVM